MAQFVLYCDAGLGVADPLFQRTWRGVILVREGKQVNSRARSEASGGPRGGGVASGLRRFWFARRGAVALEAACSLFFIVGTVGGVFEIVNSLLMSDLLNRAAFAVARDNAFQDEAASTEDHLMERARQAIRREVGDRFDPASLQIVIDVYDNPSAMLRGELSAGENGGLGGDSKQMVVVRLRYKPPTPLGWFREEFLTDDFAFTGLAIARNERLVEL